LGRDQAPRIAKLLIQKGYAVHESKNQVVVWRNGKFIAGFYWVTHEGWKMDLRHPTLYSEEDLITALLVLPIAEATANSTHVAWRKFQTAKNNKNWQRYLGLVAAHFQSLLQPPNGEDE